MHFFHAMCCVVGLWFCSLVADSILKEALTLHIILAGRTLFLIDHKFFVYGSGQFSKEPASSVTDSFPENILLQM